MAFCVQLLKLIHSSLRSSCIIFNYCTEKPLIILYVVPTVNECDCHILADNDERINSH